MSRMRPSGQTIPPMQLDQSKSVRMAATPSQAQSPMPPPLPPMTDERNDRTPSRAARTPSSSWNRTPSRSLMSMAAASPLHPPGTMSNKKLVRREPASPDEVPTVSQMLVRTTVRNFSRLCSVAGLFFRCCELICWIQPRGVATD